MGRARACQSICQEVNIETCLKVGLEVLTCAVNVVTVNFVVVVEVVIVIVVADVVVFVYIAVAFALILKI